MMRKWFAVAMAAGLLHASFSIYWGLGGDWLLETVGQQINRAFADMRWALVLVGLAKAFCAVAPFFLLNSDRPSHRLWMWGSWAGAVVLVVWAVAGCVTANLVLAGAIRPEGGYDLSGQVGHAWLWDPLFLVWGLALMTGLVADRLHPRS